MEGFKDPIREKFVIFAPERTKRPNEWKGGFVCPFCPGNEGLTPPEISRVEENGEWIIRVFPNKYPFSKHHEVIVEHREHYADIDGYDVGHMERVLGVWMKRLMYYSERPYTIIFRNYGQLAGASILHPHTQLVSLDFVPEIPLKESGNLNIEKCVLCNAEENFYIAHNGELIVGVPKIPFYPMEFWIFPKNHQREFYSFKNLRVLADIMIKSIRFVKEGLKVGDYNIILHSAPLNTDYHWHIEVIPRKGYMAGFEFGTGINVNHHQAEKLFEILKGFLK
ncbi:MAG: DUF4931 domain-containing protein [candidate division WOR-3 bacterium]